MSELERIEALENQCKTIQEDIAKIKTDIHASKNAEMKMQQQLDDIQGDVRSVLILVDGGRKVFGFAVKNWRVALTFGAGLVTAAGFGNPRIQSVVDYILNF